jgi:hypothetical protein
MEKSVEVVRMPSPLFFEFEFPVKRSVLRDGRFMLVDAAGKILSAVDPDT